MKLVDMKGTILGSILVLEKCEDKVAKNGEAVWKCQCLCEKKTILTLPGSYLRSGRIKNCGCAKDPSTKEYWDRIRNLLEQRCCRNGTCKEWIGFRDSSGNAKIYIKDKYILCRDISWIIHNGKIPDNLSVYNRCENPSCFNIEHLCLGLKKEYAIKTYQYKKGEEHFKCKLTKEKVVDILLMKGHMTSENIAKLYGIKASTVRSIWQRKNWKHIKIDSCS